MFRHILIARLRCGLRDRAAFFWSSVFPILLATLFWLALGNIQGQTAFKSIPLAVVSDAGYQSSAPLREALASASEGEQPLFDLRLVPAMEAERLLAEGQVSGVLSAQGTELELSFRSNGLNQSIIKEFADTYLQISEAYRGILAENPLSALRLAAAPGGGPSPVQDAPGQSGMDLMANYFFSLMAMACMYGGFQGMKAVMDTQANQSAVAIRNALAPVRRLTMFSASFLAAALLQFVSVLALYLYIRLGIGVSFGGRGGLILLTCALGTLMGVGLGALVCALLKKKEGLMVSVLLTVSMGGSFLAGMMVANIKYLVQTKLPLLGYLNPVNLIADAFYALYLYPSLERFRLNAALMAAFILVCLASAALLMRRPKYASL